MMRLLAVCAVLVSLTGCLLGEGGDAACDDDVDNDADGRVDCADPGCDLSRVCSPCGDGELDDAEACDDGNLKSDDGCSSRCMKEGCGDGDLGAGEECDDGNVIAADGCNFRCEIDRCGDGIINGNGEQCDDGNIFSGDGCSRSCVAEPDVTCGNGRFDPGEQCEDANRRDGDGCNHRCVAEFCGDGVVQPALGEQCEGSQLPDGTLCSSCRVFLCGNGTVDAFEQCDDGNNFDGDGCTSFCATERCGDFTLQAGEQCDDGNAVSGDFCSADCQSEFCGDGVLQPRIGELCDQGPDCTAACHPMSACAVSPSDGERCFDVDVRNASFVARSIAVLRTASGVRLETASIQAGFVERFDPGQGGISFQASYSRAPILIAAVDTDADGIDETVTANFDGSLSLQRVLQNGTAELLSHPLVENGQFVFPLDLRAAPLFSETTSALLAVSQGGTLLVAHATRTNARTWATVANGANRVTALNLAENQGMIFVGAGAEVRPMRAALTGDDITLEPEDALVLGSTVADLLVGDLDGERTLLVLTKANDELLSVGVAADGTLGAPVLRAVTPGADFFALGDVDGDGQNDVVTANAAHTLTLHLAADDLEASSTLASAANPARPVVADLDGDGRTDLAAGGGFFTPQLVVYRARP